MAHQRIINNPFEPEFPNDCWLSKNKTYLKRFFDKHEVEVKKQAQEELKRQNDINQRIAEALEKLVNIEKNGDDQFKPISLLRIGVFNSTNNIIKRGWGGMGAIQPRFTLNISTDHTVDDILYDMNILDNVGLELDIELSSEYFNLPLLKKELSRLVDGYVKK